MPSEVWTSAPLSVSEEEEENEQQQPRRPPLPSKLKPINTQFGSTSSFSSMRSSAYDQQPPDQKHPTKVQVSTRAVEFHRVSVGQTKEM